MTRSRVAVSGLAVFIIGVVALYWWQRPLLMTGAGYAAHNDCAVELVAGRDNAEADLPSNPLVPVLRVSELGGDEQGSKASLVGGFSGRQAFYTPGFGCTVASERPDLPAPIAVSGAANPFDAVPTPSSDGDLAEAVAYAFGDDLPADEREALGTRAILVVSGGELIAERYAEGFDAATPQLGWSMTKSVTNLLVGRLVFETAVTLDDAELRPEWTDVRAEITVEHLLTMTSGLSWDETYALGTPITEMLYLDHDMASFVANQEADYEPGEHLQYSSGSTNLLCEVLGRRSGTDAALLPAVYLFEPLGLASAIVEPDGVGTPVCSSYMWATPRDWVAVGQFALQDGVWDGERLLPEGWIEWSTEAVTADGEQNGYAAGWWANRRADRSLRYQEMPSDTYFARGHDGQWLVVVPSADLVVLRLGFTPDDGGGSGDERVAALVAELVTQTG